MDVLQVYLFSAEGFQCFLLTFSDSRVAGHADTLLQKRFHDLSLGTEAFSSVQYVGTQTITPPTDYTRLLEAVRQQVKNTHTRSPRQPGIVFQALEVGGRCFVHSTDGHQWHLSDILSFLCAFFIPSGLKWAFLWGAGRWQNDLVLLLPRWIFHLLCCLPQLQVSHFRRWSYRLGSQPQIFSELDIFSKPLDWFFY